MNKVEEEHHDSNSSSSSAGTVSMFTKIKGMLDYIKHHFHLAAVLDSVYLSKEDTTNIFQQDYPVDESNDDIESRLITPKLTHSEDNSDTYGIKDTLDKACDHVTVLQDAASFNFIKTHECDEINSGSTDVVVAEAEGISQLLSSFFKAFKVRLDCSYYSTGNLCSYSYLMFVCCSIAGVCIQSCIGRDWLRSGRLSCC